MSNITDKSTIAKWWQTDVKRSKDMLTNFQKLDETILMMLCNSRIDESCLIDNKLLVIELFERGIDVNIGEAEFRNMVLSYIEINTLEFNNMKLHDSNYFEYQGFNPQMFKRNLSLKHSDTIMKDIADLIQISLSTGSLKKIKNRTPEAVARMMELKDRYKIDQDSEKNNEYRVTLPRILLSFPDLICSIMITRKLKPKIEVKGLPAALSFTGSCALVPETIWKHLGDSFIVYSAVCSLYYSNKTNEDSIALSNWITNKKLRVTDYARSKSYCELNRKLTKLQELKYDVYWQKVVKPYLRDNDLEIDLIEYKIAD